MKRSDRAKALPSKPMSDQSHSNLNGASARDQKRDVSGDIHVRGEIEVTVPPNVIKKNDAADEKKETRDRKRYRLEFVGLIAVIIYAGLTFWQAYLTRELVKSGRLSTRPYVGVDSIGVGFRNHRPNGDSFLGQNLDDTTDAFQWSPAIKNFGTVPGYNEVGYQRVFINNVESRWYEKTPDKPGIIFPGQTILLLSHTGTKEWPGIRNGTDTLNLDIHIEYDGNDKDKNEHYTYCERLQYSTRAAKFMNLGPVCAK